jgi:hypothetical protein
VRALLEAARRPQSGLDAEHALDIAHDLSRDDNLRAMSPEVVAEQMHQVDLRTDT